MGFVGAALVAIGVLLELQDILHRHGEDWNARQVWVYVARRPEGAQGAYKLEAEHEANAKKTNK